MDQAARLPDGTFRRGYSGNPRGPRSRKQRHDERMNDLASDLGGVAALSAGDKTMLSHAVDLLLSIKKGTTDQDRVRITNTATRIIERIRLRRAPKRASSDPWLVELLDPHEDRSQTSTSGSARDGIRDPAAPLTGEQNERAGERPCASGEGEGEEGDAP
jgi:hypothetical protein